jgi:hypothetical protein
MSIKTKAILNAKNLIGWRTKRKIIVISVDDYGSVRIDSGKALEQMDQAGLKVLSPFKGFDTVDALENREDLEMLYEVLTSVVDMNNRPAVFTPFALPCNINFEKILHNNFTEYEYELLPETYNKLSENQPSAYKGAWNLWLEGINSGLMVPQFHGREHLNLNMFKKKLKNREFELITVLKNRSYARIPTKEYETISTSSAFGFWELKENEQFKDIIRDGLQAFEDVFRYRAVHFNPPSGQMHPVIEKDLKEQGIRYIDVPLLKKEHQGEGRYKKVFNYTGKKNDLNQVYMVRNVVFEPTQARDVDWVNYTMKQIEAAFRWNRPAIISSHRVNFCGHIDKENRKEGLQSLKQLLHKIIHRWPDVEFMAANELGALIESDNNL